MITIPRDPVAGHDLSRVGSMAEGRSRVADEADER